MERNCNEGWRKRLLLTGLVHLLLLTRQSRLVRLMQLCLVHLQRMAGALLQQTPLESIALAFPCLLNGKSASPSASSEADEHLLFIF